MRRLRAAALLALPLFGCVSGQAPRDHFYRLELPVPEASSARLGETLLVARPRSEALTAARHLVYRRDAASPELLRQRYHLWADPPPRMLQRAIAGYLQAAGVAEQVVTPELRVRPDTLLGTEVLRMERILEPGSVVLALDFSVTRAGDRVLLMRGRYLEEVATEGDDVASAVSAYDVALARILSRFLADVAAR